MLQECADLEGKTVNDYKASMDLSESFFIICLMNNIFIYICMMTSILVGQTYIVSI